jgi:beta-carotene 3-hydroxylase
MDALEFLNQQVMPFYIVVGTFLIMEAVAWFAHKYVMHGFMWDVHRDHHEQTPGFFEKNDTFFLIFAVPSAYCFISGSLANDNRFWVGAGIALYGLAYFLVHDVFIHQRFKWFRNTHNAYFMGIRKGHKVHHKRLGKEDGECFGMLLVPLRYFFEARKALRNKKRSA